MTPLDRLRKICLALPDTVDGKKIFAAYEVYRGEECISFKCDPPMQDLLCGDARCFRAPYVGNRGWVSMKVSGRIEWKKLEAFVERSYELVAAPKPKRRRPD